MIKIKAVVVGILVSAPLCDAFAFAPPSKDVVHTRLTATNNNNNEVQRMVGGAASFLAGLGVAAQMAFADPNILAANAPFDTSSQATTNEIQVKATDSSNILLSVGYGGNKGASFDTLDFSLPSYNEAVGGESESKKEAPAFTPSFPELKLPGSTASTPAPAPTPTPTTTPDTSAADAKAEQKAAAEAEKKANEEEKKAKEEEKKAKEEAAAAKKQADEEAAAKKQAEAAARKERQKQLQQEMVEKAAAAKKAEAEAAAAADPTPAPAPTPAPTPAPKKEAPAPAFAPAPKKEAPAFEVPEFKVPEIPSFSVPKFNLPKVDVPKFEAPKFDMPKLDAPTLSIPAPSPKPAPMAPPKPVQAPPLYDMDFQKPSFSSPDSSVDENLEPQEVRDGKAADAKSVFKQADKDAKEIEAQAKAARGKVNELKKDFKVAKDEACKTRPGGKLLCLRGFGLGY